jgi:prolyl oligopeptidase
MKRTLLVIAVLGCGSSSTPPTATPAPAPAPAAMPAATVEDPYLWLEGVEDSKALDWAKARNVTSQATLEAVPGFAATQQRIRALMDSKDKLPYVRKQGRWLYNFWQDAEHVRGIYRRTTLADYAKEAPSWETIIDVDALNKAESATWVWGGMSCLYPTYVKCLVHLSRAGGDSTVVREFDLATKQFVANGFALPEGKHSIAWKDDDTVFVGTDFGPGSMTSSGYPRIAKEWKRGTPLAAAITMYEGKPTDVSINAVRQWDHGRTYDLITRGVTFFSDETYLWDGKAPHEIDKPDDVSVSIWAGQLLFTPRQDWVVGSTTWPAGSLLAIDMTDYLAGGRTFTSLFTPTPTTSLGDVTPTRTKLYLHTLEDVRDGLTMWSRTGSGRAAKWKATKVATTPAVTLGISAWDDDENDDYWLAEEGFLTPSTLSLVQAGKQRVLKRVQARFDASGLEVTQHFVTSKDGTRVPYFQVSKRGLVLDGTTPTLIEGYGGFEISEQPFYSGALGIAWFERGGVYVVPNLRGGGEYGPRWHTAATKLNRQRVYEDFAAVAEDLIARKVTSPAKLGIKGGSNGGLLVGVMMTERPELFGAVVCSAPLLDMKRYHKLLAGASWMDEYGDPDVPAEWAAIAKYSPYQNVHAGTTYPPVLFTTSTRDDRVHPGHARKMAARMLEQHHEVLFYENTEGGHAGAADNGQRAYLATLEYAFLWQHLVMPAR